MKKTKIDKLDNKKVENAQKSNEIIKLIVIALSLLVLVITPAIVAAFIYLNKTKGQNTSKNLDNNAQVSEENNTSEPTIKDQLKNNEKLSEGIEDFLDKLETGINNLAKNKTIGTSINLTDGDEFSYSASVKEDLESSKRQVHYTSYFVTVVGPYCEGDCFTDTYSNGKCSPTKGKDYVYEYNEIAGTEPLEPNCSVDNLTSVRDIKESFILSVAHETVGANSEWNWSEPALSEVKNPDGSTSYVLDMVKEDDFMIENIEANFDKDGNLTRLKYPHILGYIEVKILETNKPYNIN